jgi:hypothetical protein
LIHHPTVATEIVRCSVIGDEKRVLRSMSKVTGKGIQLCL